MRTTFKTHVRLVKRLYRMINQLTLPIKKKNGAGIDSLPRVIILTFSVIIVEQCDN